MDGVSPGQELGGFLTTHDIDREDFSKFKDTLDGLGWRIWPVMRIARRA
jgi:hypothetical protein